MEIEDSEAAGNQFSYEILDQEAAKISSIILIVQQKCTQAEPTRAAEELLLWADHLSQQGQHVEAEFLYLHAINLAQATGVTQYPIIFKGLREHAEVLITAAKALLTINKDKITQLEVVPSVTRSNAA
jgi:hypothetical protein